MTVRVDKAYAVVRRYDRQLRLGALVKLAVVIIVAGIIIVVAVIAAVEAVLILAVNRFCPEMVGKRFLKET